MNEDAVAQGQAEGWDLYDPAYADFYWNSVGGANYEEFLLLWQAKIVEVSRSCTT